MRTLLLINLCQEVAVLRCARLLCFLVLLLFLTLSANTISAQETGSKEETKEIPLLDDRTAIEGALSPYSCLSAPMIGRVWDFLDIGPMISKPVEESNRSGTQPQYLCWYEYLEYCYGTCFLNPLRIARWDCNRQCCQIGSQIQCDQMWTCTMSYYCCSQSAIIDH